MEKKKQSANSTDAAISDADRYNKAELPASDKAPVVPLASTGPSASLTKTRTELSGEDRQIAELAAHEQKIAELANEKRMADLDHERRIADIEHKRRMAEISVARTKGQDPQELDATTRAI